MSKPLSRLQKEALEKMSSKRWASSYQLGCTLRTLESLKDRGLVEKLPQIGHLLLPHNNILWSLTPQGKGALAKIRLSQRPTD